VDEKLNDLSRSRVLKTERLNIIKSNKTEMNKISMVVDDFLFME
jgi:hypothetical protein